MKKSFNFDSLTAEQRKAPANFKSCTHVARHFTGINKLLYAGRYHDITAEQWNTARTLANSLWALSSKPESKADTFTYEKVNNVLRVSKLPKLYRDNLKLYCKAKGYLIPKI